MAINPVLDATCSTPRPDQGPQSFVFPRITTNGLSSSSRANMEQEPTTPRPRTSAPVLIHHESEKFRMRKARILRYEWEQALEDRAAVRYIQNLHNSYILSVNAIKTEFYDLDGLSWSAPGARCMLDHWGNQSCTQEEDSPPPTPLSASSSSSCSSHPGPNKLSQTSLTSRQIRALPSMKRASSSLSNNSAASPRSPNLKLPSGSGRTGVSGWTVARPTSRSQKNKSFRVYRASARTSDCSAAGEADAIAGERSGRGMNVKRKLIGLGGRGEFPTYAPSENASS